MLQWRYGSPICQSFRCINRPAWVWRWQRQQMWAFRVPANAWHRIGGAVRANVRDVIEPAAHLLVRGLDIQSQLRGERR